MTGYKKPSIKILVLLLFMIAVSAGQGGSENAFSLLNDRSRQIAGVDMLFAPGIISTLGLTGRGQVIGLADSGLDRGSMEDIHPDLKGDPGKKPRVIMLRSWSGRETADDPVGHGTHMAATISGSGAASGGKYRGVAPEASLYFQGLLDKNGAISLPDSLDRLFDPAYEAAVRIHIDAWGQGTGSYNSGAREIDRFMYRRPDFLVVLGAGNSGPNMGTLTAEANSKNALVAGASTSPRPLLDASSHGTADRAEFSSRGPTLDGRIKPEILAPGTSIISARAADAAGNLPDEPMYTRMQGTSMAAAVAGGSAALLRQFLMENMNIKEPQAALVKAALVNGAVTGPGGPGADGFGVLDLAGTVLALKEKAVSLIPNPAPLVRGGSFSAFYTVGEESTPLKITLVWTDPVDTGSAGSHKILPGSLVNRLHLEVKGPDGKTVYGNHFLGINGPDTRNNVQQVYIASPQKGVYTVKVVADQVDAAASPGGQKFALAFGQPLETGKITGAKSINENSQAAGGGASKNLALAGDAGALDTSGKEIVLSVNGRVEKNIYNHLESMNGAQYYIGKDTLYIDALNWEPAGVEVKKLAGGYVWAEAGQVSGGGGRYQAAGSLVTVNDSDLDEGDLSGLPPGIPAYISLNPRSGQVWHVNSSYRLKEGVVVKTSLTASDTVVELAGDRNRYLIEEKTLMLSNDSFIDTDPLAAAFSIPRQGNSPVVMPSMRVRLILDPADNSINTVIVLRQLVAGEVVQVDVLGGRMLLDNGKVYRIFPGAPVQREGKDSNLKQIREGDYIVATSLTGSDNLLSVNIYSNVLYGELVYLNREKNAISFTDTGGVFCTLPLDPGAAVTRWDRATQLSALSVGDWVQLILNEDGSMVKYIAVASRAEEAAGTVTARDSIQLVLENGQVFLAGDSGQYSRDGLPVMLKDIMPGDRVKITSLVTPFGKAVARLAAENRDGARPPRIRYISMSLEKFNVISGSTDAQRLYVKRGNGRMVELQPEKSGEFSYSFIPAESQENIQLVAVDSDRGVAAGSRVTVPGRSGRQFSDVTGHWAEQLIAGMSGRGLLAGYPDGAFRPDRAVTREELAVLLARCFGWTDPGGYRVEYSDRREISPWALGAVASLKEKDVLTGSGNSFRPREALTRAELAAVVAALMPVLGSDSSSQQTPDYTDREEIPSWAVIAVEKASRAGLLTGHPGGLFAPMEKTTRAEAAAVIYNLILAKDLQ